MPKYGIHHIVATKAAAALGASGTRVGRRAAADMNAHPGLANLGALAPDMFFWAPDYEVVDVFYTLYKNVDKVVGVYDKVMAPIRAVGDAVGDAAEEVVGALAPHTLDLVKQALARLEQTKALFESTLTTGLFAGVIEIGDWVANAAALPPMSKAFFNIFAPPLQAQMEGGKTHDVKKWYWFDMLHYRRTGRFAKELIGGASTARQRAFAYGYLSHIAADVVGHPFINQVVGAPYRLNVQRHATVENFMDTWAFRHHYNGESVSKNLLKRLNLPKPGQLPGEVVAQIDNAFRKTYPAANARPRRLGGGGFLSRKQIRQTHEILYKVMEIMEKMVVERPQEPFSGVADVLTSALDDLLNQPSPPSPPAGMGACGWEAILSFGLSEESRNCYENFFDQAEDWMDYLGELAKWTLEIIKDLLDLILATLLAMPVMVLLALLYGVQLFLYELYQTARSSLALHGFVTPEPEDLDSSTGTSLTTTILACGAPFKYPHRGGSLTSNLVCPRTGMETPTTAADFYPASSGLNPNTFIQDTPMNLGNLAAYAAAATPNATRGLQNQHKRIGSAIGFAAWMIETAAAGKTATAANQGILYTNWNLDSDRGYGYKTWNARLDRSEIKAEQYVQ